MSTFSLCVLSCLVLATKVQSYVIREQVGVSFVDSADPSTGWTLEKHVVSDETSEGPYTSPTSYEPNTVDTEERQGTLRGTGCPIGYKKAAGTCVKDEDYDADEFVEAVDRIGISGGVNKCPEGYKKAGTACMLADSESEELRSDVPVEVTKINNCPLGYTKVGPTCIKEDDDSYVDES